MIDTGAKIYNSFLRKTSHAVSVKIAAAERYSATEIPNSGLAPTENAETNPIIGVNVEAYPDSAVGATVVTRTGTNENAATSEHAATAPEVLSPLAQTTIFANDATHSDDAIKAALSAAHCAKTDME